MLLLELDLLRDAQAADEPRRCEEAQLDQHLLHWRVRLGVVREERALPSDRRRHGDRAASKAPDRARQAELRGESNPVDLRRTEGLLQVHSPRADRRERGLQRTQQGRDDEAGQLAVQPRLAGPRNLELDCPRRGSLQPRLLRLSRQRLPEELLEHLEGRDRDCGHSEEPPVARLLRLPPMQHKHLRLHVHGRRHKE